MRDPVNSERVQTFLNELASQLSAPTTVYLVGGTSAVVEGWRESTLDLDLKFIPDTEVFTILQQIK